MNVCTSELSTSLSVWPDCVYVSDFHPSIPLHLCLYSCVTNELLVLLMELCVFFFFEPMLCKWWQNENTLPKSAPVFSPLQLAMFFCRMLIPAWSVSVDPTTHTLSNPAVKAVKEIRFCSPVFIQFSALLWPQGFSCFCPPPSHFKATCEYMYMTEMDLCALPAARAK